MRKQIEILARQLAMMPKPTPFDGRVSDRDYATASHLLQRLTAGGPLSEKLEAGEEPVTSDVRARIPDADTLQASCQLIVDTYHAQASEGVAA